MHRAHVSGLTAVVCVLGLCAGALAAVPADQVPDFQVRFKLHNEAEPPAEGYAIALGQSAKSVKVADGQWSDWIEVGRDEIKTYLGLYPNSYSRQWPVKFSLSVAPVKGMVHVELEGKAEGQTDRGIADLTGGGLGLAVWRDDDGTAHVSTLGTYDRVKYWSVIDKIEAPGRLCEKILIADRYIPGDSDHAALAAGIAGLRKLGINVLMTGPDKVARDLAWEEGFRKITWAIYNPPGYAFDFGGDTTSEVAVRNWAAGLRDQYTKVGFEASDFSMYVISDEPGFYYPSMYRTVNENPLYLGRFHEYLRQQNLAPADVGAESWDEVKLIGRRNGGTLPEKRLFYWSQRFFPRQSAEHFAKCTRAMEEAFYPGIPLVVNWNYFAGRCWFPGPFGNNPDKQDPNAAMGGHEWFEFARLRGTTTPWVEDWFGDEWAYQWSYYCDKLRSASPTDEFGGYVIPRTAGAMPDGVVYKMMSLVGHGSKQIKFFTFGPEYNFPGNCYSQNTRVFSGIARAARLIGGAEELLYPGRAVRPRVAMLHHLSSEMWDQADAENPTGIVDATNANMNGACAEYTAELFDLYLALMHEQTPIEFISEEDAIWAPLERFQVIYVVEPNVPVEAQKRLAEWVKRGGVLVTTSRAAAADRYNEPSTILDEVRSVVEAPRERLVIANLGSLKPVGKVSGERGEFEAFAVKGTLELNGAQVLGEFEDGTPAITMNQYGEGTAVHFALLPGISYRRSAKDEGGKFAEGFSEAAREWINFPVEMARVEKPVEVDVPMVETPVLASEKGLAVTLLNWTNEPKEQVTLKVRTERPVARASSVKHERVDWKQGDGYVEVKMPIDTVDVLMVAYE